MMSPAWNHWYKEMGIKSSNRVDDVFSSVACWRNSLFHFVDFAELAEQTVGIRNVPMLGDQPVLNTEHINNVIPIQLVNFRPN
jgi:hypothetical protein